MRTLRDRLREMHQKQTPSLAIGSEESKTKPQADQLLGFQWKENKWGRYLAKRTEYSLEYGNGTYSLEDLAEHILPYLKGVTGVSTPAFQREELLFFDTETTGLGTGAGTTIFLFGLGYFQADRFVLEQFFLPEMASERAILHDFVEMLNQFTYLITYNGKSYDWNLVDTRFSLHRLPLPSHLVHGDLLYPSRRLWKNLLSSCRLQEVESSRLGIQRKDDVPGYLAPQLYFDFLRSQQMSTMSGVFQHNRLDILTLAHLLTHLLTLLSGTVGDLDPIEQLALGKWMLDMDASDQGCQWLEAVIQHPRCHRGMRSEAYQALTEKWKSEKNWRKAVLHWKEWIEKDGWEITPYVELAKYYEHQQKDIDEALYYTRQAMDVLLQKKMLHRSSLISGQMEELRYRANRLVEKQKRYAPRLKLE